MTGQAHTWGATPREWGHFRRLKLTADLLPVVSNPNAQISPLSNVTSPGKVPSEYNGDGMLRGLAGWVTRTSTDSQVNRWAEQPDLGICIQSRYVRAFDVDVPDAEESARIREVISHLCRLPERRRANSSKFLQVFILPGDLSKRKIVTAHGIIEFLGTGQQFVACGTHPSGVRYEWVDGLPTEIPTLTEAQFEELWLMLELHFAVEDSTAERYKPRKRDADKPMVDTLAEHLRDHGLVLREQRGALVVACPWESDHSSGTRGDSSTLYYPAGTKGYDHGAFKCLHGHCTGRTTYAFARMVGYIDPATTPEAEFGDFDDEPEPSAAGGAGGPNPPGETPTLDQPEPPSKNVFNPGDYPTIARTLLDQKFGGDAPHLRKWQGQHYRYTGAYFKEYSTDELGAKVYTFLANAQRFGPIVDKVRTDPTPFHPTKKHADESINALRSLVLLTSDTAPAWVRCAGRDPVSKGMDPTEIVSLGNGLLHMPTRTLLPHTPAFFTLNALPFDFDPKATCPTWMKFLEGIFGDDPETKGVLQEVFGAYLTGDTSHQKVFSLQGPPRCGKGVITRTLIEMLGHENIATPTLASLGGRFGLQSCIGKQAMLISDARSAGPNPQGTIEALLGVSGEDTMSIERKNSTNWVGKLNARILIVSNETLSLPDASGALVARMIVMKLTKSFLGREDRTLEARIRQEMPGIMNWALAGLDRLTERGHFVQPEGSVDTVAQMRELNSPIRTFVEENCEIGPELQVSKRELYTAYRAWCIASGMNPPTEEIMAKNLYSAFPNVKSARPRTESGPRPRMLVGIRLVGDSLPSEVFENE